MAQLAYPTSDVTVGSVWKLPAWVRGSASAAATSVTLPTHESGDIIVIAARRTGSTTAPSLPSGYTNINTASDSTSSLALRLGYKVAASGGETSGTWTNATDVIAWVVRYPHGTPIGGTGVVSNGSGSFNTGTVTLGVTDATSIILSAITGAAGQTITAPTGWTADQGASSAFIGLSKPLVTSGTGANDGAVGAGGYCAIAVEIKSVAASYFEALDEVAQDDTDFAFGNATTNALECALSSVTDPVSSTGHIVHYAVRSFNGGGGGETGKVDLYQGGTLIRSSGNISLNRTAMTAGSFTLTAGEADAITNYADLRLRFTGVSLGAGEWYGVSWANLEVPDAGGSFTGTGTAAAAGAAASGSGSETFSGTGSAAGPGAAGAGSGSETFTGPGAAAAAGAAAAGTGVVAAFAGPGAAAAAGAAAAGTGTETYTGTGAVAAAGAAGAGTGDVSASGVTGTGAAASAGAAAAGTGTETHTGTGAATAAGAAAAGTGEEIFSGTGALAAAGAAASGAGVVSGHAALTGTAVPGMTEPEVVAGGETLVITLTGDTWIPA